MFINRKTISYMQTYVACFPYICASSLAVLQPTRLLACTNAWKTHHIRLHVQYSLPDDDDDEHNAVRNI